MEELEQELAVALEEEGVEEEQKELEAEAEDSTARIPRATATTSEDLNMPLAAVRTSPALWREAQRSQASASSLAVLWLLRLWIAAVCVSVLLRTVPILHALPLIVQILILLVEIFCELSS